MRTLSQIEADILALDNQRRALQVEHEDAIHARNRQILKLFDDDGRNFRQISQEVGLSWQAVKTYLFNHGRTVEGRNARRAQRASMQ